jgi:hypothetical protein
MTNHFNRFRPTARLTAIRRARSRGSIDADDPVAIGMPPDAPSMSSSAMRMVVRAESVPG